MLDIVADYEAEAEHYEARAKAMAPPSARRRLASTATARLGFGSATARTGPRDAHHQDAANERFGAARAYKAAADGVAQRLRSELLFLAELNEVAAEGHVFRARELRAEGR